MRKMVTGGAGSIGSRLVARLVGQGYEVVGVDNPWRGKLEQLHDGAGLPDIDL